jgi:hypothetical protein
VEVEAVVPELLELVQDPVPLRGPELPDLVVDLLDVGLGARGLQRLGAVGRDALEPLPAHVLGEHDQGPIAHAGPDPGAADPEVPGGGKHQGVGAGGAEPLELLLHQDGVGGPDLE